MAVDKPIVMENFRAPNNPVLGGREGRDWLQREITHTHSNNFELDNINFREIIPKDEYSANPWGIEDQPKIEIYEFQPEFQSNLWETISSIADFVLHADFGEIQETVKNLGSVLLTTDQAGVDEVLSGVADAGLNLYDQMNEYMSQIAESRGDNYKALIEVPVDQILRKLFRGLYVGYFEIPYFGNDYLHPQGGEGWQIGGMERRVGERISQIVQKIIPIDMPSVPEWNIQEDQHDALEIEFTLYNNNIQNLAKNYKFLTSFCSGAYWSYITLLKKSPNLYHVHCPGRFKYYYCSADIKAEHIGKKRLLNTVNKWTFQDITGVGQDLNEEILDGYFPDGYKFTITLQSLLPNCYNLFLKYLTEAGDKHTQKGFIANAADISGIVRDTVGTVRSIESEGQ